MPTSCRGLLPVVLCAVGAYASPALWSDSLGSSTRANAGPFPFMPPVGGQLSAVVNSSSISRPIVILADGTVVGAATGGPTAAPPTLGALQPHWTVALGDGSSAWAGAYVQNLVVCGNGSVAVALVFPADSQEGPPAFFWYALVALDISTGGAQPPVQTWFKNLTISAVLPPARIVMACADSADASSGGSPALVTLETHTGVVSRVDLATGASAASSPGTVPSVNGPCALARDGLLLACPSLNSSTGGLVGVSVAPAAAAAHGAASAPLGGETLSFPPPVRSWSAASMGWSIPGGPPSSDIAIDDASQTLIITSYTMTIACALNGTLVWSTAAFPSTNRPQDGDSVSAIPLAPNPLRVVYFATNLDYGSSRALFAVLDVDTGAVVATTFLPSYLPATSTNIVTAGVAGEDILAVAWDLTFSATTVYHLHLNLLNRSLAVTGQSQWRAAITTPDIYAGLFLGPGPGQVLAAYGGAVSVYEGAHRPACSWGAAIPNAYIAHCCDDGCVPYATVGDAENACAAVLTCFGVTSDPATGTWTLRASAATGPSPDGETSVLILNAAECHSA